MTDPAHTITSPFCDLVSAPAIPASVYTMRPSSVPAKVIVSSVFTVPARYLWTLYASCLLNEPCFDEPEANKPVKYATSGRVRVASRLDGTGVGLHSS